MEEDAHKGQKWIAEYTGRDCKSCMGPHGRPPSGALSMLPIIRNPDRIKMYTSGKGATDYTDPEYECYVSPHSRPPSGTLYMAGAREKTVATQCAACSHGVCVRNGGLGIPLRSIPLDRTPLTNLQRGRAGHASEAGLDPRLDPTSVEARGREKTQGV